MKRDSKTEYNAVRMRWQRFWHYTRPIATWVLSIGLVAVIAIVAVRFVVSHYVSAVDPDDPTRFVGEPVRIIHYDPSHIWERYGEHNEDSSYSAIEGPWMLKRSGVYYLIYSRWEKEKGFSAWVSDSKVCLARAETAEGRFRHVKVPPGSTLRHVGVAVVEVFKDKMPTEHVPAILTSPPRTK